jgi:transmembrane sensor
MEIDNTIENYYKTLVHSFLSNEIDDEEADLLLNWLKESEENKRLFLEYKKVYFLTQDAETRNKFENSKSASWQKIYSQINLEEQNEIEERPVWRVQLYKFGKIAAMFVLFFGFGCIFTWYLKPEGKINNNSMVVVHEVVIPKGSKGEVNLPDGTHVWLNAGTRLKYYSDFGVKNRNVYLEGEAYFKVYKNPALAFVVDASGVKIKALGTAFNVKNYLDEKTITTTLEEGSVKIEGPGVDLKLMPKQNFICSKPAGIGESSFAREVEVSKTEESHKAETLAIIPVEAQKLKSDVNVQTLTSWKSDRWIIDSDSLSNIAVLLERKFNVNVEIESGQLATYKFSGQFYKETLEQILDVISLTAPVKYEVKNGIVKMKLDKTRNVKYKQAIKN